MQGRPAGHQHGELRARGEQVHHQDRRRRDVLEVIQHQQHMPRAQAPAYAFTHRSTALLPYSQRRGDGRGDLVGIGDRGQRDEERAVGKQIKEVLRRPQT